MRRRRIDPTVLAELDAVDAALTGGAEDPELAAVAAEVRAGAARMSPAFAARLEDAVDAGFPSARPAAPRRRRPRLVPALGVGTAALAAAAVAIVATSGGNGTRPDILLHGPTGIASSAVPAPATRGSASSGSAAAPTFISPDAPPRRVERAADLTIATSVGRLQDTADGVPAIADRLGGFVAQSDVSIAGDGGQATFDLRIPAGRLDEALTAISRLGHVRARSQQNTDVTGSYSAAQARLHDARAERGALLRALAAATTQPQIDSIQARLRIARGRIAAAQHAVSALRRASDLASVSVTVIGVAQGAGAPGPGGGHHPWTPGRALHDAVAVLSAAAGVAIVAVAAALPTAVVALLAALGWRAVRRRRREQALDLRSPAV